MSVKDAKINYEFLDSSKNFLYDARETGKTHTSFQYELLLFTAIKNGNIHGVESALDLYQTSGLIIGHMSDNQSREIHYWAVATIAVAIHYAILGGLDESEAYQLSDQYIQEIDLLQTMEESKTMLAMGKSINETSYTLCFCNESHFIQVFKKKYHLTPAEYTAISRHR